MNQINVTAIVIGNQDYKEKDMLVTLFTPSHGIITVTFKGVKNANAKLKSAKELFTLGEFIYTDGVVKSVTSANIVSSFYDITKNLSNFYAACNIAQIVKSVLPAGETSPSLFVDMLKCLDLLNAGKVQYGFILSKFLIRVFEGLGYRFNLNCCSCCGSKFLTKQYINLIDGDITCSNCKMGRVEELSASEYNAIRIISSSNYDQLCTLKISSQVMDRIVKILCMNFEYRFNQQLQEF